MPFLFKFKVGQAITDNLSKRGLGSFLHQESATNRSVQATRGKSPDKILFYALLGVMLWLPLPLGSHRAWAWSLMELVIQLLAIAWLFLAVNGRVSVTQAFLRAKPALVIFVLWLLYLLLQIVPMPLAWVEVLSPEAAAAYRTVSSESGLDFYTLSLDPWASRSFLLKSWAYFWLFCLVLLLVRTTKRIKLIVWVLVLSGVFQALFGSFMVLSGFEWLLFEAKQAYVGNATGTFVNRNHLAGYLNMCLALGVGWLVAGNRESAPVHWRQRVRNWLDFLLSEKMRLRIFLAMMAIALVMTHSRMGNTAFFFSLLIAGIIWLLIRRQRPRRGAVLVLTSILLLDIFILGHWFGLDKVMDRLQQTSVQSETRDDVVKESISYVGAFWLTGSGPGSFYSTFPKYMGEGSVSSYRYAHNDYLQFFLEVGVIGASLVFLLVLSAMYCALKAMALRNHRYLRSLGFGAFMGLLAILIHSAVDFNLQIPANAALFVVLQAFAWIAIGFPRGGAAAHVT